MDALIRKLEGFGKAKAEGNVDETILNELASELHTLETKTVPEWL